MTDFVDSVPGVDPRVAEFLERVADAVVVVDTHGRIVFASSRACALFGYDPGDLHGQPAEILVPEVSRDVHARVRAGYSASPHHREMGTGLPLEGRRRDGTVVPVDIRLAPLRADGLVVASIREGSAGVRPDEVEALRRREAALNSLLDTITQHLFAIGMSLSSLESSVPDAVADRVAATTELLDRTIVLARTTQAGPSPAPPST